MELIYLTLIISFLILGVFLVIMLKRRYFRKVTSKFGNLELGNGFSYIDNTTTPPKVRIGYIQKLYKNGSIKIFTPSLNKEVIVHKKGTNYFYNGK